MSTIEARQLRLAASQGSAVYHEDKFHVYKDHIAVATSGDVTLNGPYTMRGTYNGRPYYKIDSDLTSDPSVNSIVFNYYGTGKWELTHYSPFFSSNFPAAISAGTATDPATEVWSSYDGTDISLLSMIHTLGWFWVNQEQIRNLILTGLTILGNATNGNAISPKITAGADNTVLRRSGLTLGFGAINLASANAVTGQLPLANVAGFPNYLSDEADSILLDEDGNLIVAD